MMEFNLLGNTGLKVSVAGLGCGGHSRLGLPKFGVEHAAKIVRSAFESGVNFFDTSAAYGTEQTVGLGLMGIPKDSYVLSSKFPYRAVGGGIKRARDLLNTLENALKALNVECIDIYHIHALSDADYDDAVNEIWPALDKARDDGKIRFLGVTERFANDTSHIMLQRALKDDIFDVVMVGYNLLNPSAAKTVLPVTKEKKVGVLAMFAVRSALSDRDTLGVNLKRIAEKGQGKADFVPSPEILDFLTGEEELETIINAAYRFCRHTDGIDVTLTGTSNLHHLADNLKSILMGRLDSDILNRLDYLFGDVDCVSCE